MAAAIIPIAVSALSALAPLVFPKLESWIQHAEDILGAGKGTDKMDLVTQFVRAVSAKITAPGAPQATDDSITGMIEAVLQQMKADGALKETGKTVATVAAPSSVTAGPIQIITVEGPMLLLPKAGS